LRRSANDRVLPIAHLIFKRLSFSFVRWISESSENKQTNEENGGRHEKVDFAKSNIASVIKRVSAERRKRS
jgi:hypothetical protein